jgi:hypothetical protein
MEKTMRNPTQAPAANPFDVRALWDTTGGVLGYGQDAVQTWMTGATRMQTEAAAFWTGRVGKDVAAMTALAQCRSPGDAVEMQMRYARDAMADYYAEGQRLLQLANEFAVKSGFPVAGFMQAGK